jgi:hypothetical protein
LSLTTTCQDEAESQSRPQGVWFTRPQFVGLIEGLGIQLSVDGKGRRVDNVLVERPLEKRGIRGS